MCYVFKMLRESPVPSKSPTRKCGALLKKWNGKGPAGKYSPPPRSRPRESEMATFDDNSRGGLTANRGSLHASAEYKQQVAALDQLFKESDMAEKMSLAQEIGRAHV